MQAMEELNISNRLRYIAGLIPKGSTVADIGTDHGYLPIFLVKNGISNKVTAMDVRKGPLQKAENNIKVFGVDKQISLRLSDGLTALEQGEVDVVTISGMGGRLIQSILLKGLDKLTKQTKLILSPQSEIRDFRLFLRNQGFLVLKEHMLEEEGQYYVIIECVYMGDSYDTKVMEETEFRYGRQLLLAQNKSLKAYLLKEKKTAEGILAQLVRLESKEETVNTRIMQLQFDQQCIQMALEYYNIYS